MNRTRITEVARKHRQAKMRHTAKAQDAAIVDLRDQLSATQMRASRAEQQARSALENAFKNLDARKDEIEYTLRYMGKAMADRYGPQLAEAASKLIQSSERTERRDFSPDFSAKIEDHCFQVMNIRGEIPAIRYNVQIANWRC